MIDSINSASAGWNAVSNVKTKVPPNSRTENAVQSGAISISAQAHAMNSVEQRFAAILDGAQKSSNINNALYSDPAKQQTGDKMQADNLPVGIKHLLEKMVDDPAYGAEYADGYANNIHTACMTLPEYMQAESTLKAGQNQLQSAWRNILGEGKSPAQSYAELLRYELSMPQSYWSAQDPGHTMPDLRAFTEAKMTYLEQYMAAGK